MLHACCMTDPRRPQVTRRSRRVKCEPTGSTRQACVIREHGRLQQRLALSLSMQKWLCKKAALPIRSIEKWRPLSRGVDRSRYCRDEQRA